MDYRVYIKDCEVSDLVWNNVSKIVFYNNKYYDNSKRMNVSMNKRSINGDELYSFFIQLIVERNQNGDFLYKKAYQKITDRAKELYSNKNNGDNVHITKRQVKLTLYQRRKFKITVNAPYILDAMIDIAEENMDLKDKDLIDGLIKGNELKFLHKFIDIIDSRLLPSSNNPIEGSSNWLLKVKNSLTNIKLSNKQANTWKNHNKSVLQKIFNTTMIQ